MKAVRWILDPETGCLNWALYVAPDGYGRQTKDGRAGYPHRFAYEDAYGPIPEGHYLQQICGNRRCGNLEHLQPVPEFPNRAMRPTRAAAKRTEGNWSLAERLRASGKSYKEIGQVIGVEASTVRTWLKGSYAAALNVRFLKSRD